MASYGRYLWKEQSITVCSGRSVGRRGVVSMRMAEGWGADDFSRISELIHTVVQIQAPCLITV
jgi:hypothetical protein